MGASQSTNGSAPLTLTDPNILSKDTITKFNEFSKVLNMLGENDPALVTTYIDEYNNNRDTPDNLKLVLTPNMKDQISRFHSNVVEFATVQGNFQSTNDKIKAQLSTGNEVVNNILPKAVSKQMEGSVADLNKYVEEVRPFLNKNPQLDSNVKGIIDTVVNLKSRYSFFEYKYIQLNIFMLALFSNYNKIILSLVTDVTGLVKSHEKAMNGKIDDAFKLVLALLNTNQISTQDLDSISNVFNEMKKKLEQDTKETVAKINTASTDIKDTLEAIKNVSASPSAPTASGGAQQGGFVRGSSSFPQSFFELPL